jgi:glycosyltransferase involved in cell wall biosynthesis
MLLCYANGYQWTDESFKSGENAAKTGFVPGNLVSRSCVREAEHMSLERPLVSVLTPVYNGQDFLDECIESVLKQTYTHFEYIIVNNCSTDRSLAIALGYARKDKRIKVHSNNQFVGVIENHNIAFSLMSPAAKYCKVVCADDFIFPDCLARTVEFAEAHPSVGMVGSLSLAGKEVFYSGLAYERNVISGAQICRETLLGGPYVLGSPTSLLYRAELVRQNTPFFPNSNPHADASACFQALEDSDFGFVHQVLSYTRIHSNSQTSRSLKFGIVYVAKLSDLIRYGPKHLNQSELEARIKFCLDLYYAWLVSVLVEQLRNKEFWVQQKLQLREIGLRFSWPRLIKSALLKGARLLLKPSKIFRKVVAIRQSIGRIEARYYEQGTQKCRFF